MFDDHATVIADHCLDIGPGDNIVIEAPPVAEPLVEALLAAIGSRGASWHVSMMSDALRRAHLEACSTDELTGFDATAAAFESADGVVAIQGARNGAELTDVSAKTMAAYEQAIAPVQETLFDREWVLTQYPASGDAQAAGMSTAAYRSFVTDAVTLDWEAQHEFQQQLVDILDPADEVHVTSDGTDIRFSVAGMNASNEDGRKNLPGGEVGTAPRPESVDGELLFDLPIEVHGTVVEDACVTIEEGTVVEYRADRGESALDSLFGTDEGAQRLGEFGVGMNRSITTPTQNILFDEKMGDTVHFAFGYALPPTVGPDATANESAVHQDLLVDMRDTGTIRVDGDVVYEDGAFTWENDG